MYVEAAGTWLYSRPTGSNPFHPSRDPLAAILPLFPRCLQFPIPVGLKLLLMPGEQSDCSLEASKLGSGFKSWSNGD
jgi:hypothetical protein